MMWTNKGFIYGSGAISFISSFVNLGYVVVYLFSNPESVFGLIESTYDRYDLYIISSLGFCVLFLFIVHVFLATDKPIFKKILWCFGLLLFNFLISPLYWYLNVKGKGLFYENAT